MTKLGPVALSLAFALSLVAAPVLAQEGRRDQGSPGNFSTSHSQTTPQYRGAPPQFGNRPQYRGTGPQYGNQGTGPQYGNTRQYQGTGPQYGNSRQHQGTGPQYGARDQGTGRNFASGRYDFRGRDFTHFTPEEHAAWTGGRWRHDWHDGRLGWWWDVSGVWYFYTDPVYPYPEYVADYADAGPDYAYADDYDESQVAEAPDEDADQGNGFTYFFCPASNAYYPYVSSCAVPWSPVPTTPSP
jgi:hypothetical protein